MDADSEYLAWLHESEGLQAVTGDPDHAYRLGAWAAWHHQQARIADLTRQRDTLHEVVVETARELGCEPDNEAMLERARDLTRQLAEARETLAEREAMLDAIETALGHAGENVGERLVALEAEVRRYQDELSEALRERDEARALLAEREWNPTEHPQ